jgi:hypothetical protein
VCFLTQPKLKNLKVCVHIIYTYKASVCTSQGTECASIITAYRLSFFIVSSMNHINNTAFAQCMGFLIGTTGGVYNNRKVLFSMMQQHLVGLASSLSRLHDHIQAQHTR